MIILFFGILVGISLWLGIKYAIVQEHINETFKDWQHQRLAESDYSPYVDLSYTRWVAEGRPGL